MKKLTVFVLLLSLLLTLCACGSGSKPQETTGSVNPTDGQTEAPAATTGETETPEQTEEPTEEAGPTIDPTDPTFLDAQSCIGKPLADLIALIGEPMSSEYSPSCMGDGDDGTLQYEGFVVTTYRENGEETVQWVE